MPLSKWILIGVLAFFNAAQASAEPQGEAARCYSEVLSKTLAEQIGPRAYYQPILSTDLDWLRNEARFAEGPAPQKNVAILDPTEQFHFNGETKAILELKKKLVSKFRDRIIGVQKGHGQDILKAVREQFKLMLAELPEKEPKVFRREGDTLVNSLTGDRLSASDLATRDPKVALEKLGQMIPDDLVFMKKKGDEYHLIGGNLAFPTHWSIERALGASISEIHENVADTPEKAAMFSTMINRVLDRTLVTPEVVRRNNWFLELDPRYPVPEYQTTTYDAPEKILKSNYKSSVFVRAERQALRGLPESQTVAFSLQPFVYPVGSLFEDRSLAQKLLQGIHVKLLPTKNNPDYVPKVAKYLEADLAHDPRLVETKVVSAGKVNDTSSILRLEKPKGLTIVPGEAVKVTLDTPNGKATRTLSLASSPESPDLEFAVKDSDSDFKQRFKSLKTGDHVSLELTRTSLEFKPEKPAVMIAGGIGITPFRSFIQYVKDKNLNTPMYLLYGNRDQIAFETELNQAAAANPNLNVTHVLSKGDPQWQGERGRIDEGFLKKTVPTLPKDAIYYVVASPQMAEDTRAALTGLGIPSDRISIEAFPGYENGGSAGKPSIDPAETPDSKTVCYCHRVSAGDLRLAVRNGAGTLDELKSQTKAATGCGGCGCNVMGILACELKKAN